MKSNNESVNKMETKTETERVIIVGVQTTEDQADFHYSMEELEQLTETAQGQVVAAVTQKRERVDGKTYIGKGKLNELLHLVEELAADVVIFNYGLTPSQTRNIQEEMDVKVIDRTQLILDIFAMRAQSKEGKLQVGLAQLQYLLPRLAGQGKNLSRLGGGIGTRGPGETKLESDRRHIRNQIRDIKKELVETQAHRKRSRDKRSQSEVVQIGLVGYTNAGKSTLLNQLTDAETYEQNQLFATLDPLTRKMVLPNEMHVTLTDTVGFIQDLPTQLVDAFHSTLEETMEVDMILHVVDASAPNMLQHEATVLKLLTELKMNQIPILTVYNKKDLITGAFLPDYFPHILMSARDDADIEQLKIEIINYLKNMMVPYHKVVKADQGDLLVKIKKETLVELLAFNEETNQYEVSGYAMPHSKWIGAKEAE
ncbi:GTP-binding protein HflX [Isobaculum melis]|uniref:GTPase HflX n=2 Tax=Isobaculum melis TaxID=142588 RepID=A0A1H9S351_9LACT|nr:GTP-binding protein HflX [Isobaculum melis]